jgi:small GTP-binding protein
MATGGAAPDPQLVVAFVGDSGVGKTSIIRRWASNQFSVAEPPTIAHALESAAIELGGKAYCVIVWDTPGDPAHRATVARCVAKAKVTAIVFSLTSSDTFFAVPDWVGAVRGASPTSKMVLVGNKCDLATEQQVPADDAIRLATELNVPFFETGARTGRATEDLFREICNLAVDDEPVPKEKAEQSNDPETGKSECCLLI